MTRASNTIVNVPPPPPPAPGDDENPPWRQQQFDGAPNALQLKALQDEEKRRAEVKARSGQQNASVSDAIKSIRVDDFTSVHKAPCTRDSLMTAIAGGAVVGGLRFVTRAPVPKAANWAAGGFVVNAIVAYEYCQYNRRQERAKMKRAVEVFNERTAEKKRLEEEAKKKQAEESAEAARLAAHKSWYKFW